MHSNDTVARRVFRRGRWYDELEGELLPVISGGDGDGPMTLTELRDERARVLTAIDDILETARSRVGDGETPELTAEERNDVDLLEWRDAELGHDIGRAETVDADAARFSRQEQRTASGPLLNRISTPPPSAERSLDELLWATNEDVQAGTFDKTGAFRPHGLARNAIEQVIVRSSDDQLVQAPRLNEFLPEHRDTIRAFQRTVADMCIFGLLVGGRKGDTAADGFQVARSHRLYRDRWEHICRALDVDTAAEGGTWVPTGIGAELHEKVRAAGKIAPLFSRIDLPTNPWKWPIEGADATAYRVAEPTGDNETKMTASTPGTGGATFDAEIFGGRTLFSRSIEADSALAILPYTRRKMVQAFVDAEEKAILDGDTDGTHQDTDVHALGATDARWAWDGLRKKGLAQTNVNTNAATTVDKLHEIRAAMGKWGLNPADLVFILGASAYFDIVNDDKVVSLEKYGPQATILNGELGRVYGIPIVVSEHVREDLNASGVNDGITTTKTYNLCVNRQEWAMGQRMALDVEVDDSIYREVFQRVLVGFMREDFQCIGDAATNEDTAIGRNVTP